MYLEQFQIKHKKIMKEIRNKYKISTNTGSFQACFLWKDFLKICIYCTENMYAIKEKVNPDFTWAFPVGKKEEKKQFINSLLKYPQLTFLKVRDADKAFLEKEYPGIFMFSACNDTSEYIYSAAEFEEMKGKKFRKMREAVNNIKKNHEMKVNDINQGNFDVVKSIFDKWAESRQRSGMDNTIGNETDNLLFNHFKELELFGVILIIDGIPASVAIGYEIAENICDIAIFKHTGAVKDLCKVTLREFMLRYKKIYTYFNFEEDGGIEGLRTIKQRLNPCAMNNIWKAELKGGKECDSKG